MGHENFARFFPEGGKTREKFDFFVDSGQLLRTPSEVRFSLPGIAQRYYFAITF